jgi:hypothetical protein
LDLGYSKVTAKCLPDLAKLRELTTLSLSSSDLEGADLSLLAGLRHLEKLWLDGSRLNDDSLKGIETLPALRHSTIAKNEWITDQSIDVLLRCRSLRSITLSKNQISTSGENRLRERVPPISIGRVYTFTLPSISVSELEKTATPPAKP